MEQINFFKKLTEDSRTKIREKINITSNEEFVSWVTEVPKEALSEQFEIDEELISEIFESEQYKKYKSESHTYRFGFIPDSDQ